MGAFSLKYSVITGLIVGLVILAWPAQAAYDDALAAFRGEGGMSPDFRRGERLLRSCAWQDDDIFCQHALGQLYLYGIYPTGDRRPEDGGHRVEAYVWYFLAATNPNLLAGSGPVFDEIVDIKQSAGKECKAVEEHLFRPAGSDEPSYPEGQDGPVSPVDDSGEVDSEDPGASDDAAGDQEAGVDTTPAPPQWLTNRIQARKRIEYILYTRGASGYMRLGELYGTDLIAEHYSKYRSGEPVPVPSEGEESSDSSTANYIYQVNPYEMKEIINDIRERNTLIRSILIDEIRAMIGEMRLVDTDAPMGDAFRALVSVPTDDRCPRNERDGVDSRSGDDLYADCSNRENRKVLSTRTGASSQRSCETANRVESPYCTIARNVKDTGEDIRQNVGRIIGKTRAISSAHELFLQAWTSYTDLFSDSSGTVDNCTERRNSRACASLFRELGKRMDALQKSTMRLNGAIEDACPRENDGVSCLAGGTAEQTRTMRRIAKKLEIVTARIDLIDRLLKLQDDNLSRLERARGSMMELVGTTCRSVFESDVEIGGVPDVGDAVIDPKQRAFQYFNMAEQSNYPASDTIIDQLESEVQGSAFAAVKPLDFLYPPQPDDKELEWVLSDESVRLPENENELSRVRYHYATEAHGTIRRALKHVLGLDRIPSPGNVAVLRGHVRMFQKRLGVPITGRLVPWETVHLIKLAVRGSGDARLSVELGKMFFNAVGVERSYDLARDLFEAAHSAPRASNGDKALALCHLHALLDRGLVLPKEQETADQHAAALRALKGKFNANNAFRVCRDVVTWGEFE